MFSNIRKNINSWAAATVASLPTTGYSWPLHNCPAVIIQENAQHEKSQRKFHIYENAEQYMAWVRSQRRKHRRKGLRSIIRCKDYICPLPAFLAPAPSFFTKVCQRNQNSSQRNPHPSQESQPENLKTTTTTIIFCVTKNFFEHSVLKGSCPITRRNGCHSLQKSSI